MNKTIIEVYIFFGISLLFVLVIIYLFLKQRDYMHSKIKILNKTLLEQNLRNESLMKSIEENQFQRQKEFNQDLFEQIINLDRNLTDNLNVTNANIESKINTNLKSLESAYKIVIQKIHAFESLGKDTKDLKDELRKISTMFSAQNPQGSFGDYELYRILELAYGDNRNFYEINKALPSGNVIDYGLKMKNEQLLPIDSKFPISKYAQISFTNDADETKISESLFLDDIKNYINNLSENFINPPYTTDYAVLFLPSEAIFVYLSSHHNEIFEYAYSKNVFIASPSTLMSLFYSLKSFLKDEEVNRNIVEIREKISDLDTVFKHLIEFSEVTMNDINKAKEKSEKLDRIIKQISHKFEEVAKIK